ncbi:MAG: protein-tyrosine phosphatase family protein [Candidatus Hodarchaeales archaeon]|jgi:atypical dual specificity phosphatase
MFLYWIDKERFGGASQPYLSDLPFLQTIELNGIVCLQEKNNSEELAKLLKVPFLHVPIPDFGVPKNSDFESINQFYEERRNERKDVPILIHCTAGNGRTGTILASLLKILDNMDPLEAIRKVREINPLAIETSVQEDFIVEL